MMKKTAGKFYLTIKYPPKAYIAYILVMRKPSLTWRKNQVSFFLPFNEVFNNLGEIKLFTHKFIRQARDENTIIPKAPIVFPIKLSEKIPLKSRYWDEPTTELSKTERINNFLKPLENYHFQKLLVTPYRNGRATSLKAAYCFNLNAKEPEISFFLASNYLSMDEKAKCAAVYQFDNPFRFELDSGKIIKITNTSTSVNH